MDLYSIPFTAGDGTEWTAASVGLHLAEGSGGPATILSNAGVCGAAAGERRYNTVPVTGLANYRATVSLKWADATTVDRTAGLGIRVKWSDASHGYWAEIKSDTGAPKIRLRGRWAGTWWLVSGSWQALAGVTAADLEAGVPVLLQAENQVGGVRLIVRVNGVDQYDVVDTAADRVEGGGRVGLLVGATSTGADVTYDTLTVSDLVDETTPIYWGPPGSIGPGLRGPVDGSRTVPLPDTTALVLNGRYLDHRQWVALNISVGACRRSFDFQPVIHLRDLNRWNERVLYPGMDVAVDYRGTRLAAGFLREPTSSLTPPEGTEYVVIGWKELALDVPIRDPKTNLGTVPFNVKEAHAQYDVARSNQTLAQVIQWVVNNHSEGDGGLRDVGAAPASGDVIAAGALASLTRVVPNLNVSGSVGAAIEALLRFAPNRGWRVDPTTKQWTFPDRSTGALRDVTMSSAHVTGSVGLNPKANYTAVLIRGQNRPPISTLKLSAGQVTKAWQPGLESSYTRDRGWKGRDDFKILGSGTDGFGRKYIDVDATFTVMVNEEWDAAPLRISNGPAAGDYTVYVNNTTRFTLRETVWVGGNPPNVGDVGVVGQQPGFGTGLNGNGYQDVFRSYALPDGTTVPNVACVQARIVNGMPGTSGYQVTRTRAWVDKSLDPNDPTKTVTKVRLDTPAVIPLGYSLVFPHANRQQPCEPGMSQIADDVEIDLPTAEIDPGTGEVKIPELRVPTSGFRGTAYSADSTRWNGGGQPRMGDAGIKRTLVLEEPEFNGETDEVTAYTALADDVLKVLGTLARVGQFTLTGIDVNWVDISQRVTVSGSGRVTGLETATDLWVLGVEWDIEADRTTVYVGTLAGSGAYDVGAVRQAFAASTRSDEIRRTTEQMLSLYECVRDGLRGGGAVGAPDPTPMGDCQVSTGGASDAGPLSGKRLVEDSCPAGAAYPAACETFPCGTSSAGYSALAASVAAVCVKGQISDDFDPGGCKTPVQAICCLLDHVSALWATLGGIASSHDQELNKAKLNLGTIRVQTTNLVTCLNGKIDALDNQIFLVQSRINCLIQWIQFILLPGISACFAMKLDGPGSYCLIDSPDCPYTYAEVVGNCTWSFTETVCDPVNCVVPVPMVVC